MASKTYVGVPLEKDPRDDCAVFCEQTTGLCGSRRWLLVLIMLFVTSITFTILFIVYAVQNADARSCALTYDDNGAVSEAKMLEWTTHESWLLAKPYYDDARKACVCRDAGLDPMNIPLDEPVVVWIAPGDLLSLKHQQNIPVLPQTFIDYWTDRADQYATENHVKVCLQQQDLVDLRGDDSTRHCHTRVGTSTAVGRFYLGYDGALFCAPSSCTCQDGFGNKDSGCDTQSNSCGVAEGDCVNFGKFCDGKGCCMKDGGIRGHD